MYATFDAVYGKDYIVISIALGLAVHVLTGAGSGRGSKVVSSRIYHYVNDAK